MRIAHLAGEVARLSRRIAGCAFVLLLMWAVVVCAEDIEYVLRVAFGGGR